MRKQFSLVIATVLLTCGMAGAISVDGNPNDWLSAAALANIAASDDPGNAEFLDVLTMATPEQIVVNADDGHLFPGGGGQPYDVEAVYAYYDDEGTGQGLYIGVMTGFDPGGEASYLPGDLFLNFDEASDPDWEVAIEAYNSDSHYRQPWGQTSSGDDSWWDSVPVPYQPWADPYAINYSAAADYSGAPGTVNLEYDDLQSTLGWSADHNFIEAYLSEDFLIWGFTTYGWNLSDTVALTIHWTESCGNDYLEVDINLPPGVPEPMSMVMLGCLGLGMLGARKAMRRRS